MAGVDIIRRLCEVGDTGRAPCKDGGGEEVMGLQTKDGQDGWLALKPGGRHEQILPHSSQEESTLLTPGFETL